MESSSSSSSLGSRSAVPPRLAGRPSSLNPRYYPPLPSTPNSSFAAGGVGVGKKNPNNSAFVFAPSPIPTPSKQRPRASEWPFWVLSFLKLLPLYTLLSWLQAENDPSSFSPSPSPSLLSFSFFALLISSSILVSAHGAWRGRPLLPAHFAALFGNGALLAASFVLRLEGLRSFGSLETILAEFAGALLGKTLFEYSAAMKKKSDRARKSVGFAAILASVFLLSQGWGKASCFPFAFNLHELRGLTKLRSVAMENKGDDCQRLSSIFAPVLAGFFMVLQRNLSIRLPLRAIGKKRVQILTYAFAAALMIPLAILESAMSTGQSSSTVLTQATIWPLVCFAAFGQVISYYADSYAEDKLLIPSHSSKEFVVISCSVCILELCFSSDISLAGLLFSVAMLGIGAKELSWVLSEWGGGGGGRAWDNNTALGDSVEMEIEDTAKGLFRHIALDRRSKKIAIFLLMNSAFMLVEFFYGFLNNSLGLACDAFHMLFDCAALAIGLYASYISRLPASSQFNFGYGRFEVVSGYANAIFLVLGASLIVLESVERILEPPVISSDRLLAVSIGGLLVNLVGLVFFHEEHHRAHGGCSHSHEEESHSPTKKEIHNEEEVALLNVNPPPPDHSFSFQSFGPNKDNNNMQQLSAWPLAEFSTAKEVKDIHETGFTHRHDHAHHHVDHGHHHHHSQMNELETKKEATPDLTMCPIDALPKSDFNSETGCNHRHDDHGHGHGHHHDHPSHDGHTPHHDHHDCKHSHHDHDDEKNHTHEHDHHHQMDHNMFGIFLHILADTLGSVGVVISTLLIKYKNWHVADPACSIFTAAMIIFSVIPLLKNSAEIMLQRVPSFVEQSLTRALTEVGQIPGVQNLQRFHAWSYSNQKLIGSLHLQVSAGFDKSQIRKMASKVLLDAGIVDLTLQVEEMKSGLAYMPHE